MPSSDNKKIEAAERRLNEIPISKINKKLILSFKDQLAAEDLSIGRQAKYVYTLGKVARMMDLTNFRKANKKDIVKLVGKINSNKEFKDWTKYNYLVIIRRFYKWLRQGDDYPKEVKWIKPRIKQHKKTMPKQLLTIEDIKKMANTTDNLRDRCFILLLYETGARISELLNVKLSDVENDKFGARIGLQGKTGYRKIRVISAAPSINNWLSQHPNKKNNSLLFCGIGHYKKGLPLEYATFRKVLRKTASKAGINKPVNPHHFRHSRATQLAKKLTEAQLCKYMGWKIGSKEAATYVHLSGADIDDKILSLHGLKEEDREEDHMKPIICPRCETKNDPAAKFCYQCSLGLDEKSMIEYDEQKEIATQTGFATQEMLQDKEFREFYNEMLAQTYHKYKQMKEKEKN